jgi:hypothetical protein
MSSKTGSRAARMNVEPSFRDSLDEASSVDNGDRAGSYEAATDLVARLRSAVDAFETTQELLRPHTALTQRTQT